MILIRSKVFSGYTESAPSGTSYVPAQVITDYILDPIDKSIDTIEKTPISHSQAITRKTSRVRGIVRPLRKILGRKKDKNKK